MKRFRPSDSPLSTLSNLSTLYSAVNSPGSQTLGLASFGSEPASIRLDRHSKCSRLIGLSLSSNVLVNAPSLSGKSWLALEVCKSLAAKGIPYAYISFKALLPVTTNQRTKGLQMQPPSFELVSSYFAANFSTSVNHQSNVDGVSSESRTKIVCGDLVTVLNSPIILVTDDTQNIYGTEANIKYFWM